MDERPSIFSLTRTPGPAMKPASRTRQLLARAPWSVVGALGLIACVEVALHLKRWPNPIPYQLGVDEYHAVAAQIDRSGSAPISIVGSSRSREGVSVPLLNDELKRAFGKKTYAMNYSVGGGRSIDFEAIVHRLMRTKPKPRMIVIGLSERDFAGTRWQTDNVPIFWNLHDWADALRTRGPDVLDDLPVAVRNSLGRWVRLIGQRQQIQLRVSEMVRGIGPGQTPNPVRGQPTPWHVASPRKALDRKDPGLNARIQAYVARDLQLMNYPNGQQVAALERLAAYCRERNVRLILFEMPISSSLLRFIPTEINDAYRQTAARIAQENGATFLRMRDLNFRSTFRDFREPSHMNLMGAQRLTKALFDKAIAPALKREQDRAKRAARRHAASAPASRPATVP